jgi:hypothetical protein
VSDTDLDSDLDSDTDLDSWERRRPMGAPVEYVRIRSARLFYTSEAVIDFVAIKNNLSDFAVGRVRSGSITLTFAKCVRRAATIFSSG